MPPEQLRDAARKSNVALKAPGTGIQWVRSYVADDKGRTAWQRCGLGRVATVLLELGELDAARHAVNDSALGARAREIVTAAP